MTVCSNLSPVPDKDMVLESHQDLHNGSTFSCQISCFATMFEVGDHHYRYPVPRGKYKMYMGKNTASLVAPSHTHLKAVLPEKDETASRNDLKHSLAIGSGWR